jgi:hypothetical protein
VPPPAVYSCEGQRLLCEVVTATATVVANVTGVGKPRISHWKSGRCKPDSAARAKLFRSFGIPESSWDAPPADARPSSPAPKSAPKPAPKAPSRRDPIPLSRVDAEALSTMTEPPTDEVTATDRALGIDGLERVIRDTEALLPELTARDRLTALRDISHMIAAHEKIRYDRTTARQEYLASADFRADVQAIFGAVPMHARAFRVALSGIGVDVPESPAVDAPAVTAPPTTTADLDDMLRALREAADLRDGGEPYLAWAAVLRLELDRHTDAIAVLLLAHPEREDEFFALLPQVEQVRIANALHLRRTIFAARDLSETARGIVSRLLRALSHDDVAKEVEGA